MKSRNKNAGFSLIELMVTISMLAFLATAVMASLANARARAEDAAREETVNQISYAARIYASDHNETYPPTDIPSNSSDGNKACAEANRVINDAFVPEYLSSLPKNDPSDPQCIRMKSDGSTLVVYAPLKTEKYTNSDINKQVGAVIGNTSTAALTTLCQADFGTVGGFPIRQNSGPYNPFGPSPCVNSSSPDYSLDKIIGVTKGGSAGGGGSSQPPLQTVLYHKGQTFCEEVLFDADEAQEMLENYPESYFSSASACDQYSSTMSIYDLQQSCPRSPMVLPNAEAQQLLNDYPERYSQITQC